MRTAIGATPTWRLRPWPNDPSVCHLVLTDHLHIPTNVDLQRALSAARQQGFTVVRTSALFPGALEIALDAGFSPVDQLALLRLPLRGGSWSPSANTLRRSTSRPMRSWHHGRAAAVDLAAFGPVWGNDSRSISEIGDATPVHRARWIRRGDQFAGFAISGADGDNGYLQRLAVSPAHRRTGIAKALVVDALDWMCRRELNAALVNTGVDNLVALTLYERLGFVRLSDRLTIAEQRLTDVDTIA